MKLTFHIANIFHHFTYLTFGHWYSLEASFSNLTARKNPVVHVEIIIHTIFKLSCFLPECTFLWTFYLLIADFKKYRVFVVFGHLNKHRSRLSK